MIEFIKRLYKTRAFRYIFFGGCTTLVNLFTYALLRYAVGIDITVANFIAIGISIVFAYVVNKLFVFESKTHGFKELAAECAQFVGMRLSTMFIEVFGVILLSCVWGLQDMVGKLLIQVVVLVLNYIFSKVFVFSEKDGKVLTPEEQKQKKVTKRCCILGFAIPALTIVAAFMANKVYPVGDRGVLIIDSLHQYLPFFTDFHDKLTGSESLLYSFSGGLGYNFWATYAYYLASPFNFLITLFPRENMMDVMALFIVLKIGACGGIFSWYLSKRNEGKNYLPVMFGTMFALSSFMIGYYFNLMWLDSIAMTPLVMMGIERIVKGKSGKLFCLSLFYGLYCNYYIGFMLCLFSCLYFLVQWVCQRDVTVKKIRKSCVNFGWYALLAGGMAAIVLVPAYMGLSTTESVVGNNFPSKLKLYADGLTQMTSQFAFVEPVNIADTQVELNAFCGTLTLIFMVLYLLDNKRTKRERIAKALLCAFLYLSFDLNVLNFIWHGFHTQNGLPNRFAFLYLIMLLSIGFDVLSDAKELHPVKIVLSGIVPGAFVAYSWVNGYGEREWYVYLITAALLLVYTILLLVYRLVENKKLLFRRIILGTAMAEMVAYGVYGVCCNGTVGRSTYLDEQTAYQALMKRKGDDSFYRSEIDSTRMRNENMFLGANGVVLFSSTMPEATTNFCDALGIEARTNKNGYNGFTKLMNDVFGVKYVVSKVDGNTLYQMPKVDYEEPLALYENTNALSIGFMVNSDIRKWDINMENPLDVQNQFVYLATGYAPIFQKISTIVMKDGKSYNITLPAGKQVYVDLGTRIEKLKVVTQEYDKSYETYNDHLYDLGCSETEQMATLSCTLKENQEGPIEAGLYYCDNGAYESVRAALAESQLETTQVSDGKVKGTIDVKKAGTLLLTIPYDLGWKILVDGQETEAYTVGDALMGVDLDAGVHMISMEYTAPGLWAGSILTFLCVALFMASQVLERKLQAKKAAAQPEYDAGYEDQPENVLQARAGEYDAQSEDVLQAHAAENEDQPEDVLQAHVGEYGTQPEECGDAQAEEIMQAQIHEASQGLGQEK